MKKLRVLDLFSGTGSATQAFVDKGHEVITCEIDPKIPSNHKDIFKTDWDQYKRGYFDVIWCSTPCPAFSMGGGKDQSKRDQTVGIILMNPIGFMVLASRPTTLVGKVAILRPDHLKS